MNCQNKKKKEKKGNLIVLMRKQHSTTFIYSHTIAQVLYYKVMFPEKIMS